MRKLFLICMLVSMQVLAQTGYRDSTAIETRVENLQTRLDSLETELAKITIETVDTNPYATGETLDWGKGWVIKLSFSSPIHSRLECGYTFSGRSIHLPGLPNFIGSRGQGRWGLSVGFEYFSDETILNEKTSEIEFSRGHLLFVKIFDGSPVLLNFMSVSAWCQMMMIMADIHQNDGPIQEKRGYGVGLGTEMEFWIRQKFCFTIGFSLEGDFKSIDRYITGHERSGRLLPFYFRPQMGVKFNL